MDETIVIASGAVRAKVVQASREVERKINKILSYHVYGTEHMKEKGANTGWDGMSSFYSFRTKEFPAGFARSVVTNLQRQGLRVDWRQRQAPEPLGPINPTVDSFPEDPRYNYQSETAERLVRYRQMIAKAATGAGKSRIARLAHKRIGRNTLFITTRGLLMYQMKDGYEENIKEKVGVIGDGEFETVNGFNVGMVQTLAKAIEPLTLAKEVDRHYRNVESELDRDIERLKKARKKQGFSLGQIVDEIESYRKSFMANQPNADEIKKLVVAKVKKHMEKRTQIIAFLETIDLLILEEAHETGSDSYYKVCSACKNALYRLALTGTAFQKSNDEDNMRLMAVAGPIGIIVSEKMLIERGILATPKFIPLSAPKPEKLYKTTPYSKAYSFGIVEHYERNKMAVQYATHLAAYGLTSMCLVQHKAHGQAMERLLTDAGLRCSFILGENNQTQRKRELQRLGTGEIDVLIGTTILDVGVDVPSVGGIFLLGGGKDEVSHRQRIGRGLRAKKSGPNICFVFDFVDKDNKHLAEHAAIRFRIIQNTPGFAENMVSGELRLEDYGFRKGK